MALYAVIAEHYPRFVREIERSGGHLPKFVRQEFEDYLKCGLLEHGFLRVKCDGCRHEHLVAFSCKRPVFHRVWWKVASDCLCRRPTADREDSGSYRAA